MPYQIKTYLRCLVLFGWLFSFSVHAQLHVEISGVGASQIPIAVVSFSNEALAPQLMSIIIKDDLKRSGYFKLIDTIRSVSETDEINVADWKSEGADAVLVGSVHKTEDGRFDVRYKLFDTNKSSVLSAFAIAATPQYLRVTAHKIADDVYEKLTGIRGIFSTRIAYVTKMSKNKRGYQLEIADADGESVQVAFRSNEPIMSPSWSPDGSKITYVSFESKKPVVYIQNLVTGMRTLLANFKGNNSAPVWSPDSNKLALALSRDGNTQIYTVNYDGSGLKRMTTSSGIDTEPHYSSDGQTIYFTSDRSGGPQIYRMNASGGEARRVTFSGNYNIAPRISPDGQTLAYISRRDGKFQLYALDLGSNQELRLTDTHDDDSPSFAPNSKYILYSTAIHSRGTLGMVSVDGRSKQRLTTQAGDVQNPSWGPFIK
ncbi:MAG: tolB [Solimicrobium sp.]|nr:tolB [Solimicrobium sp.]